jgi:hypothetical protein
MSSAALAFLAGMGGGYMKSKDKEYDRSRQEKLDAQRDELHGANMRGLKRTEDDRTALKYAGETVTARPLEGPQPEAAYVGGAEPTQPIGYISGNGASARTFAGNGVGQEQATADAVQQNKPEARRTRMADLAAQGNTLAGTALANEASIRSNTAQATMAEQTLADRTTARSIQTLGDFDAVGAYISDTPADNQGGKFKGKFVPSADGKTQVFNKLNEDGTLTPTQRVFPNTPEGLEQAKDALAGAMTPDQRREQARHLREREQEQANKDRDFDLRKQESESASAYRNRMLSIQGAQEGRAAALHKIAMEDAKIPPGVKLQATTLAKQMESIGSALNKAMAENNFDPNSENAKQLLKQQASLGIQYSNLMKDYIPAAKGGNGLPDASAFAKPQPAAPAAPMAAPANKPAATPAAAARAGVEPQQFNEAGYVSVQSTIDGAKRGDAKALALLGVMIDRGETTPGQRMQIANIGK